MIRFSRKARQSIGSQLQAGFATGDTMLQPMLTLLFGLRGTNSKATHAAFSSQEKVARAAGILTGNSIVVWTPAAGFVMQVCSLFCSVSNPGRYQFQYNGFIVAELMLVANQSYQVLDQWPGHFFYPAAAALQFFNQSGANSDLAVTAWGFEVLA